MAPSAPTEQNRTATAARRSLLVLVVALAALVAFPVPVHAAEDVTWWQGSPAAPWPRPMSAIRWCSTPAAPSPSSWPSPTGAPVRSRFAPSDWPARSWG